MPYGVRGKNRVFTKKGQHAPTFSSLPLPLRALFAGPQYLLVLEQQVELYVTGD